MKKLRVTVDGKTFEVSVEILDEAGSHAPAAPVASVAPAAITPNDSPPPARPAPVAAGAGAVLSPLAGKVVSIDVKPGQSVAAGTQLLTLEAMKMNTFVYASKPGTVAKVHIAPGDAVEEGAALVTLN
jgi:biotin carboxyl carrier protein